jgi:hypothetical protein
MTEADLRVRPAPGYYRGPRRLSRTAPPPSPPVSGWLSWLASFSVIALFFKVASAGSYVITVSALFAIVVLLASTRKLVLPYWFAPVVGAALLMPIAIFVVSSLVDAGLLPQTTVFFQTYALWVGSMALIVMAAISRSPVRVARPNVAAWIILAVGGLQVVFAGAFNSLLPYEIVGTLLGVDAYDSYSAPVLTWNARAWGTYYEPSMCGKIITTLAIIHILRTKRMTESAMILIVGAILTKSLGLVVFAGVVGLILFAKSSRGIILLVIGGAILVVATGDVFQQRLTGKAQVGTSTSTERRITLPITTVQYALANYPLGTPLGSAETLALDTRYFELTGERKITNGVYEFVNYFGVFGIATLFGLLFLAMTQMLKGNREYTIAIVYLVLASAVSGSLFSIENGFVTYLIIAEAIRAHWVGRSKAGVRPARSPAAAKSPRPGTWRPVPAARL